MIHSETNIKTRDGSCTTQVFHPDGAGPWPGAIVYMDAFGVRPAMMEIAEKLAASGYYVLLPNLFYRVDFDPSPGMKLFSDPALRADFMGRVMPSASNANVASDSEAFLAFMNKQPEVVHGKVGLTGYCLGGRVALYSAGHLGDRVDAIASFHGGGLATDAPDSPHTLAPNISAHVYVAGAIEDKNFDDDQKARLEKALTDARVEHKVETYNAHHGWVPRDMPVHDEAATQRHWDSLLGLFGKALHGASGPS